MRAPQIGIGGSLAAPPLSHLRTYGSVSGGSADYAVRSAATEAKPSEAKKPVGRAMVSAGLFASRQGPCRLPAVAVAALLSSLSGTSSIRFDNSGESGPPCGVHSSVGLTSPASITPAFRN